MQVYNPIKRASTEQATSVNYDVLKSQSGIASSKYNVAYTFIPCDLQRPEGVIITPLNHSKDANGVAFFTTTGGWQWDSQTLSAVTNLDAHAAGVDYEIGTLVKATESGGIEAAYICIEAHTSTAGPDFDTDLAAGYWQKLDTTTFIKITHTASGGSALIAHFTYVILGS